MNTKISRTAIAAAVIAAAPLAVFAQTLKDIIHTAGGYLNEALVFLMALAVVVFVYHIVRYFIISTDKRGEAGQYVMYSVIGFFVILSMWGLVNIVQNTFNLSGDNSSPTMDKINGLFPAGSSASNGSVSGSGSGNIGLYNDADPTHGQ